jgi:para-aminobenzoate synthetase component 1
MEEVLGSPTVVDLLAIFEQDDFVVLLDSATQPREQDCRYTFLTSDPVETSVLETCEFGGTPFRQLREWQSRVEEIDDSFDLPPFCGGIAGLMSYDLGRAFERLPQVEHNDFATPPLVAGLFDWAIVWDHIESTVRFYVLKLKEDASGRCSAEERQGNRIQWLKRRLDLLADTEACHESTPDSTEIGVDAGTIESTFSESEYLLAVERVIDYIRAGDIFQANLSQQLTAKWLGSAGDLYRRVRNLNAAPFCGFMKTADFAVVSASPERFLKVERGRVVETRPIKGTRRRQQSPIADLFTSDELSASEKDRAENIMIVDLLRNDLSRVCSTGSVRVTGVCELEVFETVQHLVSTVVGQLREDRDVWDLCAACFPGGSITGAPKIRAMEIIAELERFNRNAYCGSFFFLGPNNDFDSSILIRTFTLRDGRVCFPVGGGIVADSEPQDEYQETLHKASGMLKALRG